MAGNPPHSDAFDWFDRLYREAGGNPRGVPWASETTCPAVAAFLGTHPGSGRAVVVGCGIGDDAEAVAAAGYDTVGFDVSPEAIAWCRRRFPESSVEYRVADLLDRLEAWDGAFDLVVEVRTVQSLPPSVRDGILDGVASLVAPGGRLLLIALSRPQGAIPYGPPWAVSEAELDRLVTAGLTAESVTLADGGLWSDFVAVYRRR